MESVPLSQWLKQLGDRVIATKQGITRQEALQLSEIKAEADILLICETANRVRQACCGNVVDLCSIINIKSGNCSENCAFCSQSAHHPTPNSPIYGLKSSAKFAEAGSSEKWRSPALPHRATIWANAPEECLHGGLRG